MLGVYASVVAILLGSLVLGRALLHLLGHSSPSWLSGAVGFAALTVACPLLIRLPGRAATLAVLIGVAIVVALVWLWRGVHARLVGADPGVAAIVAVVVLAAASLPF